MNQSPSIAKLASALSKAQAEMPAAHMNATNPFLKNKYADLGSVIETAKPILAKHGLSVAQFPVGDEKIGLETILMHESGEFISASIFMQPESEKGKSAAQVAGSIISYLRRYSLSSVLGIYADEDTDGSAPAPKKSAQVKQQEPPTKAPSGNGNAPSINPQFLVDNGLSSNIAHAAAILNGLKLGGQKATDDNLKLIKKYRELKDGGMTDEQAFAGALA